MSRPHRPDASASLTTLPTTAPSLDVPMPVTYHREPLHRLASRVPLERHREVAALAIALGLVAAWALVSVIHNDPETSDLFYLPILLAVWSFGLPGGVPVGVTAGMLIGPLGNTGRAESGTQFDPDVVSTFGDLVTRGIVQPAPAE